jgi:hypothetical protein
MTGTSPTNRENNLGVLGYGQDQEASFGKVKAQGEIFMTNDHTQRLNWHLYLNLCRGPTF